MNKKYAAVIGVLALLVVGAGVYVAVGGQAKRGAPPTSTGYNATVDSQQNNSDNSVKAQTKGEYKEYSAEAFNEAKDKTRLLFFHASWCPQCRELEASINAISLPADVVIFKVDYDSRQDLRQKYGVTLQTTVVKVDKNDNKLRSFVAYDDPSFAAVQRELQP